MKNQEIFRKKSLHFALLSVLMIAVCRTGGLAYGATAQDATFSWQANPASDQVVGYRLYYGPQSRFAANRTLKANFSYPQYVDFTDFMRCSGVNYSYCEPLDLQELQCDGLSTETPTCTLSDMSGTLFFTMTAYSNTAESEYTQEIKWSTSSASSAASTDSSTLVGILNTLLLSD